MALITDADIQALEDQAAAAARAVAEFKRGLRRDAGDVARKQLADLIADAELARAKVERERERQSAQRVELTARAERERAAGTQLARLDAELTASLAQLVADASAAQAAEANLVASGAAYNAMVAKANTEVGGLTLRLDDVDSELDHQSGVAGRVVRVRGGRHWRPIDEAALPAWVTTRVHRAAYGARVRLSAQDPRELDDLLADVPPLPRAPQPGRLRPPTQRYERQQGGERPFLARAEAERLARGPRGQGAAGGDAA